MEVDWYNSTTALIRLRTQKITVLSRGYFSGCFQVEKGKTDIAQVGKGEIFSVFCLKKKQAILCTKIILKTLFLSKISWGGGEIDFRWGVFSPCPTEKKPCLSGQMTNGVSALWVPRMAENDLEYSPSILSFTRLSVNQRYFEITEVSSCCSRPRLPCIYRTGLQTSTQHWPTTKLPT